MKRIKIKFEYKCFPVWIYGEDNRLIDNDLPETLIGDEVDELFSNLQNRHNSLYLDNGTEFKFKGFISEDEKKTFENDVKKATDLLKSRINTEYIIEE